MDSHSAEECEGLPFLSAIRIIVACSLRECMYVAIDDNFKKYESNAKVLSNGNALSDDDGFVPTMHKRQEKTKSTAVESPNSTDGTVNSSELLTSIDEGKTVFAEALNSLNLLEDYIQCPSEKTSKPLTLLFDRGKSTCDETLTEEKIDNSLEILRNCLIKKCFVNADSENIESPYSDHNSTDSGKKEWKRKEGNYDRSLDYYDSQPNSISSCSSEDDFVIRVENEIKSAATDREKSKSQSNDRERSAQEMFERFYPPSDKKQDIEMPRRKMSSSMIEDVPFQINNLRKQRITMEREIEKLRQEKAVLKLQLHVALLETSNDRVKELEKEINSLKVQRESLQIEQQEVLAELGKLTFEKTAKENEERKAELFQRTFRSPTPKVKRSVRSTCNTKPNEDDRLGCPNGFPIHSPNGILNGSLNGFSITSSNTFSSNASNLNDSSLNVSSLNASSSNASSSNFSSGSYKSNNTNAQPPPVNASVVHTAALSQQTVKGAIAFPSNTNSPSNDSSHFSSKFYKSNNTNENFNPPPVNASVVHTATLSQQAVKGAEAFPSNSNSSSSNASSSNYSSKSYKSNDTNEISKPPPVSASVVHTAALSQQVVHGAKVLPENRESNDESTSMNETTSNFLKKETTIGEESFNQLGGEEGINQSSGGEGINQSGKRKETNDMGSTSRDESSIAQSSTRRSYENLSFPIEQDDSNGREFISLRNVPPTSVATTLYNNYKLLLLTLAQRLLFNDVYKMTDWASQTFSIDDSQNAVDLLFKLDEKQVINASDLSQLRHFFESIIRIDLVYIIDAFLLGDYSFLWQNPTSRKREAEANRTGISQRRATSWYPDLLNTANTRRSSQGPSNTLTTQTFDGAGSNSPQTATLQANADRNLAPSRKPENNNEPQSSVPQLTHKVTFPNFSGNPNLTNSTLLARAPNEAQPAGRHGQIKLNPGSTGYTTSPISTAVTADGPVTSERKTTSSNSSTRLNPAVKNQGRNTQPIGSNGFKHSKFGRPESERANVYNTQSPGGSRNQATDGDEDGNWLCSHYKRRCYVKFECCDKFWPCHRCHNNQSSCGRKKLKSRDTKMLKCVNCNKVQQFGECCIDCNSRFAKYFCRWCKHLTGTDDHPYHCEKCGICRIHGDRSFHCDICGVCLDVQLRGNHKCREGSAHDECCICLEDAFTGCQILPCSHKVHKDCATQMIRSGITRCPICRESFAHKLERRPPPNQRKRSGK